MLTATRLLKSFRWYAYKKISMNKPHTRGITNRFLQVCAEVIQEGHTDNRKTFAESVGEHQQNLSLMEKGRRAPTLEQIVTACKKYGYSANWLVLNMGQKKLSETVKGSVGSIEQRVNNLETEIAKINRKLGAKLNGTVIPPARHKRATRLKTSRKTQIK